MRVNNSITGFDKVNERKVTVDALESFRSRWRRWLGQKTIFDKPYWTTLLNSNWTGWVYSVCGDDADFIPLGITAIRLKIKKFYLKAINKATMDQLYKLDELYCIDKFGL